MKSESKNMHFTFKSNKYENGIKCRKGAVLNTAVQEPCTIRTVNEKRYFKLALVILKQYNMEVIIRDRKFRS